MNTQPILLKTARLEIAPLDEPALRALRDAEPDADMRRAYGEMLNAMRALPGREAWGAEWRIRLAGGPSIGGACFKGAPDAGGAVEIGYGIDGAHQGRGYATEAVRALAGWAAAQPGVRRILAQTEPDNAASRRVLEKCGFMPAGQGEEGPLFCLNVAEDGTYRAAFAEADITPDFPVEMIGCWRPDNRAAGVYTPLMAQVLLLASGDGLHCLVTIDNLGLTVALSDDLRARVAGALGTDAARVMLNFSHTHAAPAPLSPLNGQRYFSLLCERVADCAKAARDRLAPCLAAWALGEADFAENRRAGCDAVDRRLGALRLVRRDTGAPIVTVLRVAGHANVLMTHGSRLSSDYFGAARAMIGAAYASPVMLVQGAAGNLKPIGVDMIEGGAEGDEVAVAARIAAAAQGLVFDPVEIWRLEMAEKEIEMVSDVPDMEEARRIVERAGVQAEGWLAECARLRADGVTRQTLRSSLQFLWVNEGCLCGVPDEIFCEIALDAATRAGNDLLFFNGYTNGCAGYLPHAAEWVKGGYETHDSYLTYYPFHGHVMPYRMETAARLVDAVLEMETGKGGRGR